MCLDDFWFKLRKYEEGLIKTLANKAISKRWFAFKMIVWSQITTDGMDWTREGVSNIFMCFAKQKFQVSHISDKINHIGQQKLSKSSCAFKLYGTFTEI